MTIYTDKLPSDMCKERMREALATAQTAREFGHWDQHALRMDDARKWHAGAKKWLAIEIRDKYTMRTSQ